MMTKELKQQIESMAEDICSDFVDAYQCQDWGISAVEFSKLLIAKFNVMLRLYAEELDEDEEEEDD